MKIFDDLRHVPIFESKYNNMHRLEIVIKVIFTIIYQCFQTPSTRQKYN